MGIKRKSMHKQNTSKPESEKDYENEEIRPDLHVSGPHAIMLGAEDLKQGDRVRQTVEWVVTSLLKREENGKDPTYELTLSLDKASDLEECGKEKSDDDDDDGADWENENEPNAAMDYLTSRANRD